jgi:DNA-binding winged helix-turn-helix (wHTH) protein/predicted ATPase/tetratricopeptide (TPR) repeat protein
MTKRLRFGPFVLDVDRATLARETQPVELQPKVFDLVALLATHPDRIFSKQELLERLWPGTHVTEASLHQSLRKARRALGEDPDQPRYIEVVSRRGWRWMAPTEEVAEVRASSDLVGREAELQAVMDALAPGRVVVLSGPGGIGKTRLAREALALSREGWQGACAEISLLGCTNAVEIGRAVARQLDIPLETAETAEESVSRALSTRAMLLLLDEAEACADPLSRLLARWSAPGICWLVTSRVELHLPGGAVTVRLSPLGPEDAARLLQARAARDGITLTEPDLQAVLEPLDGLPLAIELAAGRLRLMPASRLVERLRAGLQVLSSGEGRGLHTTLQTSWELLSEPDRHLLCGCAVFGGPFTAEEAERCGGDVLDGLDRLVGASLLSRVEGRLELAGLIRTLAEVKAQEGYGADFVRAFVTQTAARARASLQPAARFDTDALLSLRESLPRLARAEKADSGGEVSREVLAVALAFACRYGGPWDLADEALAQLEPSEPGPAAKSSAARFAPAGGERGGTLEPSEPGPAAKSRSVAISEDARTGRDLRQRVASEGGDHEGLARTLRGEYAARLGRLEEAERWLSGVQGTALAWAQMLLARLHVSRGRLEDALELAQTALDTASSDGDDAVAALALDVMGTVWRVRAEPERVRDCYERALARLLDPRCRIVRGVVAQNQAASLGALGLHEEGIVGLSHALDALVPLPVPHLVAVVRGNLALALLAAGRAQEAAPLLEVALAQAKRSGDRRVGAKHAVELALCRAMLRDGPETERLVGEASAMQGDPVRILMVSAWAALARGEPTRALARAGSALAAASEAERREVWPLLYVVARKVGDVRLAERLRVEQHDSQPTPELVAWMEASGPRPELPLVAGGRLPLDTWVVWALLG